MPSIINASSTGSGGIVQTADASGVLQLQSNGTTALTVSGSTVTFAGAPSLPAGSITQASLAANVVGNGPTFRAEKGSGGNQTIGSAVWTKVTFPNESWDTNSNYDTTTSRFQPTVAGYYSVIVAAAVTVVVGTQFAVYRNGAFWSGALGTDWLTLPALVYLNGSTDYVEGYIFNNTGLSVFESATLTTFSASLVRAG
jgi:hypothetical protein